MSDVPYPVRTRRQLAADRIELQAQVRNLGIQLRESRAEITRLEAERDAAVEERHRVAKAWDEAGVMFMEAREAAEAEIATLRGALVEIDTYLANDPAVWRIVNVAKAGEVLCDVLGAELIAAINASVQANLCAKCGNALATPTATASALDSLIEHERWNSGRVDPTATAREGGEG